MKKQQFWFFILTFIWIGFMSNPIRAQIYCQGDGCSSLPLSSQEMNNIFYALQTNYLNEVMSDMSTANAFAIINTIPTPYVNLDGITFGINTSISQTSQRKIDVVVPDYGTLEDIPSAGVALVPGAFIGMNLGSILPIGPRTSRLALLSPYRFDLYLSYLNSGVTSEQLGASKKNESWEVHGRTTGIALRYHLIEGDRTGYIFGFRGISIGMGYHSTNQKISYKQQNSKVSLNATAGTDLIWKADNEVTYKNKLESYVVDIKTGIQVLYFLRLSIGAGHSWLKGNASLVFNRYGPITVYSDLLTILGYSVPETYLGILIQGNGSPKQKNVTFLSAGVEFNIPIFKIFFDAKGAQNIYSINLGIRMDL